MLWTIFAILVVLWLLGFSLHIEIGRGALAVAHPVGSHTSADTDCNLNAEILTYSRASGTLSGITLDGSAIRRDDDSTEATYGQDIPHRRLLQGNIAVPGVAQRFLEAVRDAKARAIASNSSTKY
jgi:lipid-binding SYLF domain-containing protein